MSISLYYNLARDQALSDAENSAIDLILKQFSETAVAKEVKFKTFEWERIHFYSEPTENGMRLAGSTKLPGESQSEMWSALQHWCEALSALRRVLPNATWHVSVDDHDIVWDPELLCYDPSR
jgi:hypothetical protein